jgi:hypothetical protein
MERAATIDFAKARAQARDVTTTINREGMPHPTFVRASQNMAATASLLDTFSASFTSGVDKVYRQLRDILSYSRRKARSSGGLRFPSRAQAVLRAADKGPRWNTPQQELRLHQRGSILSLTRPPEQSPRAPDVSLGL